MLKILVIAHHINQLIYQRQLSTDSDFRIGGRLPQALPQGLQAVVGAQGNNAQNYGDTERPPEQTDKKAEESGHAIPCE